MSFDSPTFASRLRMLVAKTFRAEKLYSSMRNVQAASSASTSGLTEIANDIRAREWQKAFHELRTELSDILTPGISSSTATHVADLLRKSCDKRDVAGREFEKHSVDLQGSLKNEEYASALRTLVEVIQLRARHQATRAITDELSGVLESAGRSLTPKQENPRVSSFSSMSAQQNLSQSFSGNVVSLARKTGTTSR
jgi:hypothetical protein